MQVQSIVFSDDENSTRTSVQRRRSIKLPNKQKINLIRLGVICSSMALLSILVAVAFYKLAPTSRKSNNIIETKKEFEGPVFKAVFSSNYIISNENQSFTVRNIDDITYQFKAKLNESRIRVINGSFSNDLQSEGYRRMMCENSLGGNAVLQLNLFVPLPHECASQDATQCKIQLQEQLQEVFAQIFTIPMTIEFDSSRLTNIRIKICDLLEMTEGNIPRTTRKEKESTILPIKQIDFDTPSMTLKKSTCQLNVGRIARVQMTGEEGSYILDDRRKNTNDQNRQYLTITLYEDTTYRLNIQFLCGRQLNRASASTICDVDQNINVWIDFNDNGFEESERRIVSYSSSDRYRSSGQYDLDISIPSIDERYIKSGYHRMRLSATINKDYRRTCSKVRIRQIRDYTVHILPKARYQVNTPAANLIYTNPFCSQNRPKIVLVLMAGEIGTQIRDDLPAEKSINQYDNRHHMSVTIYEDTAYLLRVQLDCPTQLSTELSSTGCNLAQDVNVYIDINDDGRFDQSEVGTPYHWPLTSYMAEGVYDLQIYVPRIDERYMRSGRHRMRIVIMPSETYRRNCGRDDYSETREYIVNILPLGSSLDPANSYTPVMALGDVVCSLHIGKIILVVMAGEHRTQIRDDSLTRSLTNENNPNFDHLAIVLYEGTVYLLRIQLDCNGQPNRDVHGKDCSLFHDVNVWIDLNEDGRYDQSENAAPFRWPLHSYTPQGVYDLQIYIPVLDTTRMRTGPYRMRLVVSYNEQYRRQCGDNDYRETREYTVNIISKNSPAGNVRLPYLALSDNVCSLSNAKIVLVLMTGEQGSQIRDDVLANVFVRENQNQHHVSVTVHENSVYRLRVQLDCDPQTARGSTPNNCNLAQDINIWIDSNNDGNYQVEESRVPHRWPLHSSMPLGIYDFEITIPMIDRQYRRTTDSHRMRIVVSPSEDYRRKCGRTDYSETREYTVNIIPKTTIPEPNYQPAIDLEARFVPDSRRTHCSPGNLICSHGHQGIVFVRLLGEQNTEIRDETRQCSGTNNHDDRSHTFVRLFDGATYTLTVQLYCQEQYPGYSVQNNCNVARYFDAWIDWNNDGIFDENREHIYSSEWDQNNDRTSQYNIQISIPTSDVRRNYQRQHRVRLLLTEDESNRKPCSNSGYGEARDYTLEIFPQAAYE